MNRHTLPATHANSVYQEFLAKSLTEKYTNLSGHMDKIIHDANSEIVNLREKMSCMFGKTIHTSSAKLYRQPCKSTRRILTKGTTSSWKHSKKRARANSKCKDSISPSKHRSWHLTLLRPPQTPPRILSIQSEPTDSPIVLGTMAISLEDPRTPLILW